jgi:hypothetical protein
MPMPAWMAYQIYKAFQRRDAYAVKVWNQQWFGKFV